MVVRYSNRILQLIHDDIIDCQAAIQVESHYISIGVIILVYIYIYCKAMIAIGISYYINLYHNSCSFLYIIIKNSDYYEVIFNHVILLFLVTYCLTIGDYV